MILAVAALWISQSITITITLPPKSGPVVYSFSPGAPGWPIVAKQVSLDSSVQLGQNNDVVFARPVPPRDPGYWIQATRPIPTVFGPARDLWCLPGASNARPIATLQYVDWQQGDLGTNSYLALFGLAVTPSPGLPLQTNVISAPQFTFLPSDSFFCGGQPSIAFFDSIARFSVFVFVLVTNL